MDRLRSRRLPRARTFFFSVQSTLHDSLLYNPHAWPARKVVFYTHPEDPLAPKKRIISPLRGADFIITMNSWARAFLVEAGWPEDRVATVLCGSDPTKFQPHARGEGAVGLCSLFHPRKAPDRILAVARSLRHRHFILLGRNWKAWKRFDQLRALPNLEYVEADYDDYPLWYSKMDVFLSPSLLEGGPIPLLEAMLSNCVPVASRTGFAGDIINHEENGFLFDVNAPTAEVSAMVEAAFGFQRDIRTSVEHLTWHNFGTAVASHLFPGDQ